MPADEAPELKRSLKDILNLKADQIADDDILEEPPAAAPETREQGANADNCCECGDQPKDLLCLSCEEPFCQVCFDYIHRTGKRKDHDVEYTKPIAEVLQSESKKEEGEDPAAENESMDVEPDEPSTSDSDSQLATPLARLKTDALYVPMRLSMEERKLLRLLEAALEVSEYTDRVDVYSYGAKVKRIVRELKEICTVLTGLVVANGLDIGKELVEGGDFSQHAAWYQSVFEVGRRYKIMNPERMRSNYGKLVYMIMDSRLPEIRQILDFDLYKPVLTVHAHLQANGALAVLEDPLLVVATMEIKPSQKSRREINSEIRTKERGIEVLVKRYGEPVRQALYSLGDYHSYLEANKTPVDEMIQRLRSGYDADQPEGKFSLAISSGRGGARLSHNHRKQYQYRLEDTGQGLNRVKVSPKVSRAMHTIISRAQRSTGSWVGSSVVHLGDRAVPNALFFLDKYSQVQRILNPVNTTVRLLPQILANDRGCEEWVHAQYGSTEALQKTIVTDFFKFAFDGSGADNFYDAGSCIDGRLTSAWNWANQLPKKPFYKHFLIAGFVGFDGTEGF